MRTALRLSNQCRLSLAWSSPRAPVYKGVAASLSCSLPPPRTRPSSITFSFRTYTTTMSESPFYKLKAELPNGQTYDFEQLKGKVVLIVNVASKWCVQSFS